MKKFIYLLAMSLWLGLVACGDDKEDNVVPPAANDTQQGNTSQTLPDPEGTVLINMYNGKSQSYNIGIGSIYIDDANNFCAKSSDGYQNVFQFISLGMTGGLSQIKDIPLTGWAKSVAVVPGTAYIAKRSNYSYSWGSYNFTGYSYARLYVVDYIVGTSGGIIGAIVKYQSPFEGSDEET